MKIETDAEGTMVFKEVFNGVILETGEGSQLGICMRDDTFEITVWPGRASSVLSRGRGKLYRLETSSGIIYQVNQHRQKGEALVAGTEGKVP